MPFALLVAIAPGLGRFREYAVLSAFAYVLLERLRAMARQGTALAQATAGTIRRRLCKLAARMEVSVRRLRVRLTESAPVQALFAHAWRRLCPAPG
jgi:hypothetical protein